MSKMKVPVLFAMEGSVYHSLPGVEVWDPGRNAFLWPGGSPGVYHPPCGPWSSLRAWYRGGEGGPECGLWAVDRVRRWGGVLEHPRGSLLWSACGMPLPGQGRDAWGGWTWAYPQQAWGHRAEKPTWFYVVGLSPGELPAVPMVWGEAPRVVTQQRGAGYVPAGSPGYRCEVSKRERLATPRALAEWLVEAARRVAKTSSS